MQGPVCPLPLTHPEQIVMGHGSGGKMSHDLITHQFIEPFENPALRAGNDAAVLKLDLGYAQLAISTDSHVVDPLFFPGGDIGRLAVCGTVNDVAMMGAKPIALTAGFILEEGLNLGTLRNVIASMQAAATEAGVQIVAGDTKVVQKGKADGMYVNTTGFGIISPEVCIGGAQAIPGDVVILSGPIGDHGIAVLSARGELGFDAQVQSDIAPLNDLVAVMMDACRPYSEKNSHPRSGIHVLRDPTRGGVATSLNEIARQSQVCILLRETSIPVRQAVSAVCEMLGFDPLYVANEGKLIAIVDPDCADDILMAMRNHRYGLDAVVIGEILPSPVGRVLMKTTLGSTRIVDMLAGEMLPRIC